MARGNTGLLVAGGILGALLLLGRKQGDGGDGGGVSVKGSVGLVTLSAPLQKRPGEALHIKALFSVEAKNPDGTPRTWEYKVYYFIKGPGGTDLQSDSVTLALNNGATNYDWFTTTPANVAAGAKLSVTVQLYGAVPDVNGNPGTSFTVLSSKVLLDAIEIVQPQVLGSVTAVNVSQRAYGFSVQGGIFAPPPFRPPRSRPITAPPPFSRRGASLGNALRGPKEDVRDNPWLERRIAPI